MYVATINSSACTLSMNTGSDFRMVFGLPKNEPASICRTICSMGGVQSCSMLSTGGGNRDRFPDITPMDICNTDVERYSASASVSATITFTQGMNQGSESCSDG